MKKEEIIRKYGEAEYERRLQRRREWHAKHHERTNANYKEWAKSNPDKAIVNSREQCHKGGTRYGQNREYDLTGLRYKRNLVRGKHRFHYRPYKCIIAPESQLHHEWIPETADYRGVALVESDRHMHGYIDVIQILEGEITLLTEAGIRGGSLDGNGNRNLFSQVQNIQVQRTLNARN